MCQEKQSLAGGGLGSYILLLAKTIFSGSCFIFSGSGVFFSIKFLTVYKEGPLEEI